MALAVFCSYAHEDEGLHKQLRNHLALLERQGQIAYWHDRCINAGDEWRDQIDEHARSAHIILLLISADFVASEYCYDVEMKTALDRHSRGEAKVIPIILRSADCSDAPFSKLQALPRDGIAITSRPDRDEAFRDVAHGVRQVVKQLRQQHKVVGRTAVLEGEPANPPVSPAPGGADLQQGSPNASESEPGGTILRPAAFADLLRDCSESSQAEIDTRIRGKYAPQLYVPRRREERWVQEQLRDDSKLRPAIESGRRTVEDQCQSVLRQYMDRLQKCEIRARDLCGEFREAMNELEKLVGTSGVAKAGASANEMEEGGAYGSETSASWVRGFSGLTAMEVLAAVEVLTNSIRSSGGNVQVTLGEDGGASSKENRGRARQRHALEERLQTVRREAMAVEDDARKYEKRHAELKKCWDETHTQIRALESAASPSDPACRPRLRAISEGIGAAAKLVTDNKAVGVLQEVATAFRRAASSVALIVDKAGGGKTNLLCRFTQKLRAQGVPTLFVSGKTPVRQESDLLWRVILERTGFVGGAKDSHLAHLDSLLAGQRSLIYVIIDGINEADDVAAMNAALAYALEKLSGHRFFFFVSCRDIYWSFFAQEKWIGRFVEARMEGGLYEFTEDEVDEAIPKYTHHFHLDVTISQTAKEQLRHPLLLRFFCEAYGDVQGPVRKLAPVEEIRLKPIFDQYWREKLRGSDTEDLVRQLADRMFMRSTPSLEMDKVSPEFTKADRSSHKSTYNRLRDEHVIVREERRSAVNGEKGGVVISFVYEPFMEYTIARSLYETLRRQLNESDGPHLAQVFEDLNSRAETFLNTIAVGEMLAAFLLDADQRHELSSEFVVRLALAQKRWLEAKTVANILDRNERALPMLLSEALTKRLLEREGTVSALLESCERGGSKILLEACAAIGFRLLVPEIARIELLADAQLRLARAGESEVKQTEDGIRREIELEAERAREEKAVALADPMGNELEDRDRAVLSCLSEWAGWVTRERLIGQPAAADRWKPLRWKHDAGMPVWELQLGEARAALLREIVDAVVGYSLRRQELLLAYAANGLLDGRAPVRKALGARVRKLGRLALLFPSGKA